MNMSLYELNEEIAMAEKEVELWAEEHEGDITDCPFEKIIGELEIARDDKALNCGVWYKNLVSQSKALAEEIKSLTARKKAFNNKAERIKNYIFDLIPKGENLESTRCKIGWRKSKAVMVSIDPKALPEEYQKVTVAADKTELKTALQGGEKIEGVSLQENQSIQIK